MGMGLTETEVSRIVDATDGPDSANCKMKGLQRCGLVNLRIVRFIVDFGMRQLLTMQTVSVSIYWLDECIYTEA